MEKIRAVLFDLDGTLVDSVPDLTVGINTIMASLRMRPFTEEQISTMVGKGVRVLVEKVCDARGIYITPQTVDTLIRRYAQIMTENDNRYTRFYPGAIEGLDRLRAAGIRTAIVTNKIRVMAENFVVKTGLDQHFDTLVAGDDTRHAKPAADMLLLACKKLGVSPSEAVMVGDSRNDALAAQAAQMPVYLVTTGYNEGTPIKQWGRDNGFEEVYFGIEPIVNEILRV